MKLTLTVNVDLSVLPFPEPLPLPELLTEYRFRQRALAVLLKSPNLITVMRCVVADALVEDGGVMLAQSLCAGVQPRDAHLMFAALDAQDEALAVGITERLAHGEPMDAVISQLLDRVRIGRMDVARAELECEARSAGAAQRHAGA